VKGTLALRSADADGRPNSWYGREWPAPTGLHASRTTDERGFDKIIACVEAGKKVLGKDIGLALDCGPAGR